MPPAACMAAAAEITAMMMSIASNGGSPGSSPKPKTRTSVPTPPHRPRPIPPERTPSAMKPTTIRPSIAISSQSLLLVVVSAGSESGSSARTSWSRTSWSRSEPSSPSSSFRRSSRSAQRRSRACRTPTLPRSRRGRGARTQSRSSGRVSRGFLHQFIAVAAAVQRIRERRIERRDPLVRSAPLQRRGGERGGGRHEVPERLGRRLGLLLEQPLRGGGSPPSCSPT